MITRGESITVMYPLFQEGEGGSIPTSPLQMRVERIPFRQARELNKLWHSRLPRFGTGCVENRKCLSFGATFKGKCFAVGIWSNPVARNLPQQTWLELRRLATSAECPPNTCSWMIGVMARLIKRMQPDIETLVSYHDTEVHSGTIYKAAGWIATTVNQDGNWTRPGRKRPKAQSESPKQRWEKVLTNQPAKGGGA